ncbi:MAG: hypothetical protein AABW68_03280 [archaeon]
MGTMTFSTDDTTEKLIRDLAKGKYGEKKGAIAATIKEGIQKLKEERDTQFYRRRAIARLEKGYDMGKIRYKTRAELYDRD